jgi:hypothetical protein
MIAVATADEPAEPQRLLAAVKDPGAEDEIAHDVLKPRIVGERVEDGLDFLLPDCHGGIIARLAWR